MKESSNQPKFRLYHVDMKYIRNLHHHDDKVPSVSPQINKQNRVFLGIIIFLNNQKYCIPLSHAKTKYNKMTGKIDFSLITDSDGKILAALNFNLMIPVEEAQLSMVDINIKPKDSEFQRKYKILCRKELTWCRNHKDNIINKAKCLYELYHSGSSFAAKKRCLNFPLLENECKKYNTKEN